MLVVSGWHLWVARDVLPDRTSSLIQALGEREAESARIRAEQASLRALRPEAASVAEWKRVKDLVDQRMFSWSTLFAVLEETLPDGVRLEALDPEAEDGKVSLQLEANARTHEEAMLLMSRMEERPEFAGVRPTSRTTEEDGSIHLSVIVERYVPQEATPAPAAASSPAPAEAPAPEPPSAALHGGQAVSARVRLVLLWTAAGLALVNLVAFFAYTAPRAARKRDVAARTAALDTELDAPAGPGAGAARPRRDHLREPQGRAGLHGGAGGAGGRARSCPS